MVLWSDLTVKDKIKLFSYWSLITIITNLVQLFGALTDICSTNKFFSIDNSNEFLIGMGCMMAWIGSIRYMDTSKKYSILGRTLSLSMPNVIRTLISTLPILMGYTFLGMCLFYRSNRFSSAAGCLSTLYSLMNGDMVYDTFSDLRATNYLFGQIYLYTFIFFSICVIQSLFISVIEDAHLTAKYTTSTDIFYGESGKKPAGPEQQRGRQPEADN